MDYDTSWCSVCDKQIAPKRTQVPIETADPTPTPLPAAPAVMQRRKSGRAAAVQKKQASLKAAKAAAAQQAPTPPKPVKTRTVIDQGPAPLYCSEECQIVDLNNEGMVSGDYNPHRDASSPYADLEDQNLSPSLAYLSKLYGFAPIPPPMPVDPTPKSPVIPKAEEYNSGIMMANKFLSTVCSYPNKAKPYPGQRYVDEGTKKKIPGWNDGSNGWRAALYSFSSPVTNTATSGGAIFSNLHASENPSLPSSSYDGFVASSHRSSRPAPIRRSSSDVERAPRKKEDAVLIEKFSDSLGQRSASRTNVGRPSSLPSSPPKARPLLAKGAEGKLLVPQVKMRTPTTYSTASSSSLPELSEGSDSVSSLPQPVSRRGSRNSSRHVRSPLSMYSSEGSAEDPFNKLGKNKHPETRAWSYDNVVTYPAMNLPTQSKQKLFTFSEVAV